MAGHDTCPSAAATYSVEVAVVSVPAMSPWQAGRPAGGVVPTGLERRLLCPHDLAQIVVVAEPPGPGSEGMGSRAAGR